MVVKTKFMTVRSEDLSGVGENASGTMYLLFKSGVTHSIKYNEAKDCHEDCERISDAMAKDVPSIAGD